MILNTNFDDTAKFQINLQEKDLTQNYPPYFCINLIFTYADS